MTDTATITVRIPTYLRDDLDRLAKITERSRSYLSAKAVAAYVRDELAICDAIEEGIEDMKAGRVVPHEQVMAESESIIAAARAKRLKSSSKGVKRATTVRSVPAE